MITKVAIFGDSVAKDCNHSKGNRGALDMNPVTSPQCPPGGAVEPGGA